MLLVEQMCSKLIEIALHDKEFDMMLIHERNYMEWYTALRVLQSALRNEDTIANESGEALETSMIQLQNTVIPIEFNSNSIDHTLLNAYNEHVRPFFKREQMNIFFLSMIKVEIQTRNLEKPLCKAFITFSYAQVDRIQLNPDIIVRRLYKSGKFDGPIKEASNKR